jgi:hypothetical protein
MLPPEGFLVFISLCSDWIGHLLYPFDRKSYSLHFCLLRTAHSMTEPLLLSHSHGQELYGERTSQARSRP